MRWHFRLDALGEGAHNMALDEALMGRAARTGEAVFRVYGWSSPTLSLGRNQRARGCYDEDAARAQGVRFVRRPTGGRALLHHREVTYSATLPLPDANTATSAYDFINEVLLGALARLGVNAERATGMPSMPPGLRPCFDVPAEREIVVGGRKLVGSAQWRRGSALLQHGSILIRDDQAMIARLTRTELDSTAPSAASTPLPPPKAATLADAMHREPAIEEVARSLLESLEAATGSRAEPLCPDADLERDVERLSATYADDRWTWRR